MNLFQSVEKAAARGAEGLRPAARATLVSALRKLQRPDGGFAGLDGRSDPYYALFAWLSLRALGAAYDRAALCAYMAAHRRAANRVDARCARLLLAAEGRGARASWLAPALAVLRGDARDTYGAFLLALAAGRVPRWLARLAWRRQQRLLAAGAAERLPTPRLAAALALAALAEEGAGDVAAVLATRRCAGGGFASAAGAPADLLATAVARFALALGSSPAAARIRADGRADDLSFVQACWLDDGLFGASPAARQGDAEHTFYGLLALGTCR